MAHINDIIVHALTNHSLYMIISHFLFEMNLQYAYRFVYCSMYETVASARHTHASDT